MPIPSSPTRATEKILLVAAETSYGTDAVPTGVDAVRCWDFSANIMEADEKTLNYVAPYMGARPSRLSNIRTTATFKMGLIGAGGAAGGVPPWDAILRSCGLSRVSVAKTAAATISGAAATITGSGAFTYARTAAYAGVCDRTVTLTCTTGGGTGVAAFTVSAPAHEGWVSAYSVAGVVMTVGQPFALPGGAVITISSIGTPFGAGDAFTVSLAAPGVAYHPTSDRNNHLSFTAYYLWGTELHRLIGARATAKVVYPHDDVPYFEVSMTSLFTLPEETVAPSPNYTSWDDPLVTSTENTPTRLFFGDSFVANDAAFDLGLKVDPVLRMGRHSVRITERASAFSAVIEAPKLSEANFWVRAHAREAGAVAWQHGTTAGSIVRVEAGKWQIKAPKQQEADGDYMLSLEGKLLPTSGDDEFTIFVR